MTVFGYACDRCREKHQSCNHELPCKRCIKANAADSCHYTPKRTRNKMTRPSSSASMMSSTTSSSSNSNSPMQGQMGLPLHAFMPGFPIQPMQYFDSNIGGMFPYSPRSSSQVVMMQQQTPQYFAHSPSPQSLFSPGPPFACVDSSGDRNPRLLPPLMPCHGLHVYPGHSPMHPHHSMAGPQYHPYHAPPALPLPSSMMMMPSANPYIFVPPNRCTSRHNRPSLTKQSNGRRVSHSALGEALCQSAKENFEDHINQHGLPYVPQPLSLPSPFPYPSLLDSIHSAASQYYHAGHASIPEEEARGYHSMDGSALMASGVLVQEYIRDALAMRHDENVPSPLAQHPNGLDVGVEKSVGLEEMKQQQQSHYHHDPDSDHDRHHDHSQGLLIDSPQIERDGFSALVAPIHSD